MESLGATSPWASYRIMTRKKNIDGQEYTPARKMTSNSAGQHRTRRAPSGVGVVPVGFMLKIAWIGFAALLLLVFYFHVSTTTMILLYPDHRRRQSSSFPFNNTTNPAPVTSTSSYTDSFGSLFTQDSVANVAAPSSSRGISSSISSGSSRAQDATLSTSPTGKGAVMPTTPGTFPLDTQKQEQLRPMPPPPPMPLPRPVRLVRIPKAGSSSFSAFLRWQYQCVGQYPPGDCTRHNRHECPSILGCTNHGPIPDWQNTKGKNHHSRKQPPPKPNIVHTQSAPSKESTAQDDTTSDTSILPKMITFLRHPISRYVSAYTYPGHHGQGTNGDITLHTRLFPEYNNVQTSYLSRHAIGTWDIPNGNQPRRVNSTSIPPAVSDEEWQHRLHNAGLFINSTEHVTFVGIVEYWLDSLRLFCRMYTCPQWGQAVATAKPARQQQQKSRQVKAAPTNDTTINKNNDGTNKHTSSAVMAANAMDWQLYKWAVARFCTDLHRYRSDTNFVDTIQSTTLQMCDDAMS